MIKVNIVLEAGSLCLVVMQALQVVDTQMLGTVTVEIQLAPASILMLRAAQAAAGVTIVGNNNIEFRTHMISHTSEFY
jgi:hypothetical protein